MADKIAVMRRVMAYEVNSGKLTYEFTLTPSIGFLGSPDPLLTDCELLISFDRTKAQNVLLEHAIVPDADKPVDDYIKINDCMAITEWVSSQSLRDHFMTIENNPILYEFDDCEMYIKNIPASSTCIRFDNIRGGNVPEYIFAGITSQSLSKGDYAKSSTCFQQANVSEFNITLNGSSVGGYPIEIKNGCPVYPLQKFLDVTNRYYNIQCGESMSATKFGYNFLWSHKFEGEVTPQGWLGINLKLREAFTDENPMCLVIWVIAKNAISVDKFHQIQKINL